MKDKILDTAARVFAEKSYEGARMDEIAKLAGVPKSLIYYHFQSKEEIFKVLINRFVSGYMAIAEPHLEETHQEKAERMNSGQENLYYEFGLKNEDVVRLIFIDALKKKGGNKVFFEMIDQMTRLESNGSDALLHERRVAEFFTSFLPCCAYICFADGFTEYFHMERKVFDELFMDIFNKTHGAYHKNHL